MNSPVEILGSLQLVLYPPLLAPVSRHSAPDLLHLAQVRDLSHLKPLSSADREKAGPVAAAKHADMLVRASREHAPGSTARQQQLDALLATDQLRAEMKLLNWHKLANDAALKAALPFDAPRSSAASFMAALIFN